MKRRIPTVIDDSGKFKLIDVVQGATEAGYVVEGVIAKRGQGIEPDDIPEAEQLELLDLVWNAPESDIWTIGMVFQFERDGCPRSWALSPARPAVSRPPGPVCASWAKSRSVFPARATNGEQRARFVRVGHQLRAPNTPHSAGRENTL